MMQPATAPKLPASMAGNPAGPGSSPVAAPGGGAGNEASARAKLKGAAPMMYQLLAAFPVGTEDWKNMMDIVKAVGKIVGSTENESLVPSAIQQMALAAKQGGPLKSAPPVGIQPAPANANIKPPEEPEPV